jgi:hypothetical protein
MSTCTDSKELGTRCSEEDREHCPRLREGISYHCDARWGSIRPGVTELRKYCLGSMHVLCAVFMRFSRTGRPLTRWEYAVETLKHERLNFRVPSQVTMSFEP